MRPYSCNSTAAAITTISGPASLSRSGSTWARQSTTTSSIMSTMPCALPASMALVPPANTSSAHTTMRRASSADLRLLAMPPVATSSPSNSVCNSVAVVSTE